MDFFRTVDNLSTRDASNSDIVSFSDSSDARNVSLEQEMLGKIRDSLLSDNNIWPVFEDIRAHECDFCVFLLQGSAHGVLSLELHVGLTLSLLVLERAVKEDDAWVADLPPHLGVGDVLIDHNSIEHSAVLQGASWDLLNSRISLYLKVELACVSLPQDGLGGSDGEVCDKFAPSAGELGSNAAL